MINYRACLVNGKKAIFHQWITDSKIVIKDIEKYKNKQTNTSLTRLINNICNEYGILPEYAEFGTISKTYGLVEFEDGIIKKISPENIKFIDNPSVRFEINIDEKDSKGYFVKKDEEGNPLYIKSIHPFRYGANYTYDENNNCTSCKKEDGTWWIERYDSNNNPVYFEDNNGTKMYREYDKNGNITHYKSMNINSTNIINEFWAEYDEHGRMNKKINNDDALNKNHFK